MAYDTPEFRKLQREWYKKLADAGFRDIETTNWDNGEQRLERWDSIMPVDEPTAEYYTRAKTYQTRLELELDVWRLHSEGYTNRRILAALRHDWPDITYRRIQHIVTRHKHTMLRSTESTSDE